MDIVVHAKDIMNANASIIYRKKGDFTSYGVDFDQYVYKTIPSVVVCFLKNTITPSLVFFIPIFQTGSI